MLSGVHFYHRITRKMVVAFGTMFNNITLKRYNKAGTQEIERINVPLMYAQKEKFYERITQDPNLSNETTMTLPRMSFEMDAITYDPLRKRSNFTNSFAAGSTGSKVKNIVATPYNFDFTLTIYVRNVEDGTQIVEQILPYFAPDYTLTMSLVDIASEKVDVPFILNSVSQDVNNVGVSSDNVRIIMWTLTFTAKGYMYGATTESKIIRKAIANTYDSTFNTTAQKEIIMSEESEQKRRLRSKAYYQKTYKRKRNTILKHVPNTLNASTHFIQRGDKFILPDSIKELANLEKEIIKYYPTRFAFSSNRRLQEVIDGKKMFIFFATAYLKLPSRMIADYLNLDRSTLSHHLYNAIAEIDRYLHVQYIAQQIENYLWKRHEQLRQKIHH